MFNTLCIEINTDVKKISFGQNKEYQKYLLFSFTSSNSSQFYFWFAILIWAEAQGSSLSKTVCEIFHFRFRSVFIKFMFLFNKMHTLFDFKTLYLLLKLKKKAT